MGLFEWNSGFSVGVQQIDDQHKKLIDLINQLQEALSVGKGKEALGKVLAGLADYTQMHFSTEETWMKKFDYADFASHKKIHDDLIKQVTELRQKFQAGSMFLSTEVMTFLQNWLNHHISNVDKKLGAFLNEKGIK